MNTSLPEERKKLYADERNAVMNLCVGIDALKVATDPLQSRMKYSKTWGKFKGAFGIVSKVFGDILDTVPADQLFALKRNMELMRWESHVKSPMGHKDLRNDGMWLPLYALDEMAEASRDRCMMCNKSVEEQRKCPLAKALDLLPVEGCEENARGCKYYNGL